MRAARKNNKSASAAAATIRSFDNWKRALSSRRNILLARSLDAELEK
jgi:hypothetical protein